MTATKMGQRFLVSGRVQGVFFRRFTQQSAQKMGLTGWVRNLPDGKVEAKAFGTEEQLKAFIAKLWEGPVTAQVDNVRVEDIPIEPFLDFVVR